eukprot:8318057-Pyramimonas_sp.AAC.1
MEHAMLHAALHASCNACMEHGPIGHQSHTQSVTVLTYVDLCYVCGMGDSPKRREQQSGKRGGQIIPNNNI